jgi:hypothetical protein
VPGVQLCFRRKTPKATGISTAQHSFFIGHADLFQRESIICRFEDFAPTNCQQNLHEFAHIARNQHHIKKRKDYRANFGLFGEKCQSENLW